MKKVFHVILDEKFIDNAIVIFDSLPGISNEYLLVCPSGKIDLIKKKERITVFKSQFARLSYIRTNYSDVIILHSLFFGATLVPFASKKTPLVWISWGHDLYKDKEEKFTSSFPFRHSLFKEETRNWVYSKRSSLLGVIKKSVKNIVKDFFRSFAISKISYVSTCLPYEYQFIQKKYPHLQQFQFDYIDNASLTLSRCNGFNILIGNSASINCNHLDTLTIIGDRHLKTGKIVVPLSYAGGDTYRQAIILKGKSIFGEKFYPLTDFMNIDEYMQLLNSCGFAVMGFLRQQATKNIQLLLCQGTKVFFYKETEIYAYFKNRGYTVFSIEDDLTPAGLESLLTEQELNINRSLVLEEFNYETNINNVTKSLNGILHQE